MHNFCKAYFPLCFSNIYLVLECSNSTKVSLNILQFKFLLNKTWFGQFLTKFNKGKKYFVIFDEITFLYVYLSLKNFKFLRVFNKVLKTKSFPNRMK